jgi:alkylation response protein AidB-like acyl-CoA dehydrogenase
MEFEETPPERAFREEARAFLAAHARPKPDRPVHYLAMADGREDGDQEHAQACRRWQAVLAEHGWAGLTWPPEWGGRGLTANHARIFAEEEARFDVPRGAFQVAITMVGPTLMAHGTDAQKKEYLPKMLRGEHIWCQLFSEPGAGSDLAGLATRASFDAGTGEWVVEGQKVWTSGAHYSDFGILLARTDWDAPKHEGITYFVVDMRSPGVEVRPLRQINGAAHFNETFLSGVRIPDENVVGTVHGGWGVARTTLANERQSIGSGTAVKWPDIARLARQEGAVGDPVTRQRLARTYTSYELLKWLGWRVRSAARAGRVTGSEGSLMKLLVSRHVSDVGDLVLALEGARGALLYEDAPDNGFWQQNFLTQWSMKIGGGTDQVQRNVIGERMLGLPREPGPSKDTPFRDLPRS